MLLEVLAHEEKITETLSGFLQLVVLELVVLYVGSNSTVVNCLVGLTVVQCGPGLGL